MPLDLELAAAHDRDDLERMRAVRARAAPRARRFVREREHVRIGDDCIEAAEIIEQHFGRRGRRKRGAHRRVGRRVAQQAIAHAAMRNCAQLIADREQAIDGVARCRQIERDREQRREPAERARDIDVVGDVLAAVAFEIDAQPGAAGFLLQRAGKATQQHIVDLRAEGLRYVLEQRARFGFGERCDDALDARLGRHRVDRKRRGGHVADRTPMRQRRLDFGRPCVRIDASGPRVHRRAFFGITRLGTALRGEVRGFEILAQEAPRDTVDHEMVYDEQHAAHSAGAECVMNRAQQRAAREVERRLRLRRVCHDRGGVFARRDVRKVDALDRDRDRVGVTLRPAIGAARVTQAQRVVLALHCDERAFERARVEILGDLEQKCLIPPVYVVE